MGIRSHQNMAVASASARARHTDVPAKYVRVITSRKDPIALSFVLGAIFWYYLPLTAHLSFTYF